MKAKLIKKNQVETKDFGNGLTLQILLDKIEGAKNLDVGTVSIPAKGTTAMHSREFEEVIYMVSGTGVCQMEDGTSYILETGIAFLFHQVLFIVMQTLRMSRCCNCIFLHRRLHRQSKILLEDFQ